MHVYDMPGPSPAFTMLVSLNAPLAFIRAIYYRHVPELLDRAGFIAAIGLLWYYVALNIESLRRAQAIFASSRLGLRLATDFLLVAAGVWCGFWSIADGYYFHLPLTLSWPYRLSCCMRAIWSVSLIFFFGRDFIICIRQKNNIPFPSRNES
jgi:hypothetical protein